MKLTHGVMHRHGAVRIAELARRVVVSMGGVFLYLVGAHLPTVSVDAEVYQEMLAARSGDGRILAFSTAAAPTLFGLGVVPVLTALLLLGLGGRLFPKVNALAQGGPAERLRYLQLARKVSLGIALVSALISARSTVTLLTASAADGMEVRQAFVVRQDALAFVAHIAVLVAGFLLILVLAEFISRYGLGNGVMVLTVAMVLNQNRVGLSRLYEADAKQLAAFLAALLFSVAMLVFASQTRHVTHLYGLLPNGNPSVPGAGISTTKISAGAAGPVLFASSLLSVLGVAAGTLPEEGQMFRVLRSLADHSSPAALTVFAVLTILLARFYVLVTYDPVVEANETTRSGRFVFGRPPGLQTARYFYAVSALTSWMYAAVLAPVMLLPVVLKELGVPTVMLGGAVIIPTLVLAELIVTNSRTASAALSRKQ